MPISSAPDATITRTEALALIRALDPGWHDAEGDAISSIVASAVAIVERIESVEPVFSMDGEKAPTPPPKSPDFVTRTLDLSNSHTPPPGSPPLRPDFGDVRTTDHEYGWIVFLPPKEHYEPPDWFKPVVDLAHQHGCTLVLFDRDAACIDGLKTYNW